MKKIISMKCPICGGSITENQKECEYCGNSLKVSSSFYFDIGTSINANKTNKSINTNGDNLNSTQLSISYLLNQQYKNALMELKNSVNKGESTSDTFFLIAIAILDGKKPFVHIRTTIDEVISNLNSAIEIEEKPIYYYLRALVKFDYFHRKHLRINNDYLDDLQIAKSCGLSDEEIDELHATLKFEEPNW